MGRKKRPVRDKSLIMSTSIELLLEEMFSLQVVLLIEVEYCSNDRAYQQRYHRNSIEFAERKRSRKEVLED